MEGTRREAVLVGHPLTALERELKRLVVREELEKEQLRIIKENGLSTKDVKNKLLKLYELYETFRNEDNTCLSDTDTKYNLYRLYHEVFQSKRPYPAHSPVHSSAKLWREKPKTRAATATPHRTVNKQTSRQHVHNSVPLSVPATFPHNASRDPPPTPHGPGGGGPANLAAPPRRNITSGNRLARGRPHSAPADFQYNKLYTANRCYTTRRTCKKCSVRCTCVSCCPLQQAPVPCWRDITCAVTPDKNQIEAHWAEMSPLIEAHLQAQKAQKAQKTGPPTPKPRKKKKSKDNQQTNLADSRSTGSREEVRSVKSRGVQLDPSSPATNRVQQAWTSNRQSHKAVQQRGKPKPAPKRGESVGVSPQKRIHRQRNQYSYQRNKKTEKRYRWDKVESDSDSSDGNENGDILAGIDDLPHDEDVVYTGRILRERKRHKWGDYQAVLTARALYLFNREYDHRPKEMLPLWGTKLSINADKTDLQYSFILKTSSTNKNKAMYKMSCLTEGEMRTWLTKLREAMKLNIDITAEIARNKKPSVFGELPEHPSWSHEGYRIDVSYITDNILVCSFPPTRSDVYELKRFMDDKHKGHYKIVNVCEKSYDATMFGENVSSFPTPPNGVSSLTDLWNFCEFTDDWLKEDDSNVVLVHCQTGNVPSGLFVAAYLVHSRICWTSEQAIKHFRTKRENGMISLPCQKRYLKYIETSVIAGDQPEDIKLLFSSISMSNSPAFNEDGSCKPYFVVFQNGEEIYEYESSDSYKTEEPVSFPLALQISGDIKLQFYSVSDILGTQEMFTVHFHTFYINSSHVRFSRDMIDGAHLNTFKQFTDSFSVTLEVK
ncbi:hypothetical protein ACHWQZ_G012994 [Mnemiopsis leidyi]